MKVDDIVKAGLLAPLTIISYHSTWSDGVCAKNLTTVKNQARAEDSGLFCFA